MVTKKNYPTVLALLAVFISFPIEPGSAGTTLSYEQKMEAIDSLRAYEQINRSSSSKESRAPEVNGTSDEDVPGAAPASVISVLGTETNNLKVNSFSCDEESEHSCELQEFMHKMQNGQTASYDKSLVSDGKYKVTISFDNDGHFSTKYVEKQHFENVPESAQKKQKNKIFEYYLGAEYPLYNPELMNAYKNIVSIVIHVSSSDDLLRFLQDDRVQGIHHIGNAEQDLEEGYH